MVIHISPGRIFQDSNEVLKKMGNMCNTQTQYNNNILVLYND